MLEGLDVFRFLFFKLAKIDRHKVKPETAIWDTIRFEGGTTSGIQNLYPLYPTEVL